MNGTDQHATDCLCSCNYKLEIFLQSVFTGAASQLKFLIYLMLRLILFLNQLIMTYINV